MSSTENIHTQITDTEIEVEDTTCKPVKSLYDVSDSVTALSFFSTPRMISRGNLSVALITIYPVDLFFQLKSVMQRIKFVALLSGIMEVEVRITSGVYATGIAKAAIDYRKRPLSSTQAAHQVCSMDGVVINISTKNPVKLRFPVSTLYPYLNISTTPALDRQRLLPRMHIKSLTTFDDSSTGTTPTVEYQVFACIKGVNLNTPTAYGNADVYVATSAPNPNVGAEATGIFSYPASIVEMASKTLSDLPIIGKYMYATSLAASAIKNIAVLFGFSRPPTIETSNYANNLSTSVGPLDVANYTLDPLAEVPLVYDGVGCNECSLTFKETVGRYGMYLVRGWLSSYGDDQIIATIDVNPTAVHNTNIPFIPTPLAYFSSMYRLWRGSIKYRFTIAANSFVRGKLRLIWCPDANFNQTYYTANKSDVLAHSYNVLIDLSQATEVEFIIPHGHKQPYLPILDYANDAGAPHQHINGCICVLVEEPLKAPVSTFIAHIMVENAAGEDFELAIPSNDIIQRYSPYTNDADVTVNDPYADPAATVYSLANLPARQLNETTMVMTPCGNFDTYVASSKDFNNSTSTTVSNQSIHYNNLSAPYFIGEKYLSHRPLLKRFFINSAWRGHGISYRYQLQPAFPIDKKVLTDGALKKPTGFRPTPLTWCSHAFGGYRGSTRVALTDNNKAPLTLTTNRVNTFRTYGDLYSILETINQDTTLITENDMTGFSRHYHSLGDDIIVNYPYQFPFNYIPFQELQTFGPNTQVSGIMINDGSYELRHAIGEDFNFVHWSGMPELQFSTLDNVSV